MKTIVKYIKSLYDYSRYQFIMNLLFMLMDGLTSGISLVLLVPLLSLTEITGHTATRIAFLDGIFALLNTYDNEIKIIFVLSLYLLLIIIQAFISRKMSILNTTMIQGYTKFMRDNLFEAIVKTDLPCFESKKKSDITNAFSNEITRIASGTVFFLRIISQITLAAFQIAVAFYMSVTLTLFVILCAAIIFLCMKPTLKKSKDLGDSLRQTNQKLMSNILEQLNGIKEIKCYGIEDNQIADIKQTTENTKNNLISFTNLQTKATMLYKIAAAIAISVLFYISLVYIKIEPAVLLILIYIFARLWPMFTSFQNNLQNVLSMIPSFESLTETITQFKANAENYTDNCDNAFTNDSSFCIAFQDVSFTYKQSEGFELKNLDFVIPDKGMTAIVGKSGSGKSTIVNLLLGLIRPKRGLVRVNAIAIDESNMMDWRKCVGYVPQDPFLLNGTIRENLIKFNPRANDEEIVKALKLAAAWDFIEKTELGLNTIVGDNGVKLSGGERQRIVLARALLRNPKMLVLDEATSALDNENEYKIQEAIENLADRMTIVVIAHRLSTIVHANNIIVIDDGRIVEQGSYSNLARTDDGYFRKYLDYNRIGLNY